MFNNIFIIHSKQRSDLKISGMFSSTKVLKTLIDSEWGAPSFTQPKPKENWVRFLSVFRNLNNQLKCKPYPMPEINKVLLRLESFQFSMYTVNREVI